MAGTDASFSPDGADLVFGCGLAGDGSPGDPVAVAPVAGQGAWSDDWGCDAATHSTLKCDPADGTLWTPPEHAASADEIYQEHFPTGWPPVGVSAWGVVNPGANAQFNVPPDFLSDCRRWAYWATINGFPDLSVTADATFEVGWAVQVDGGPVLIRPLWSRLSAPGAPRREMNCGATNFSGNHAAGVGMSIIAYPALHVLTGSVTINSWRSDSLLGLTTS